MGHVVILRQESDLIDFLPSKGKQAKYCTTVFCLIQGYVTFKYGICNQYSVRTVIFCSCDGQ